MDLKIVFHGKVNKYLDTAHFQAIFFLTTRLSQKIFNHLNHPKVSFWFCLYHDNAQSACHFKLADKSREQHSIYYNRCLQLL